MIAVDDIGWFRRNRAFTEATALNRREIDLAGRRTTMPEAAEILPTPSIGRLRSRRRQSNRSANTEGTASIVECSSTSAMAPISLLEREFGRTLTKLPAWHASTATNGRLKESSA